jgi:hypothetical protein
MSDEENPYEGKYVLHSRIDNTFHFRLASNPEFWDRSFSITYIWDGQTNVSGDMGTISFQRNNPGNRPYDYGFPNKNTGLEYFEEKVKRADYYQKTTDWNAERAIKDLRKEYEEYYSGEEDDDPIWDKETFELMIETIEMYSEDDEDMAKAQMMEYLCKLEYEFGDMIPGEDYTESFKKMLWRLKSVSGLVWDEVQKEEISHCSASNKVMVRQILRNIKKEMMYAWKKSVSRNNK